MAISHVNALGGVKPMETSTVQTAPSQPAEAKAPEAKSDARSTGNMSVAQAAQRLLNMERETAQAKAEHVPTPPEPEVVETSAPTEAAQADPAEPEAKPEPELQAEVPEEADGDNVPSHDLTPELQKKIDKRIGKEVAKRKALEAQLNEMKLEIARQAQAQQQTPQTAPIAPLPQGTVPLANIQDVQGLSQLQQQAKEAKRFAEEQLDRDDFEPVQVGDNLLDKSALKTIIRNANKTLEDDIPARYQFLQARNQAQQAAFEKFPFLKDKSAPEYVQAQSAYLQMPWLRNLPNADWIIGVQIEGLKALEAKEKAKTAKAPAKPVPAVSTKPPASQTVVSSAGSDTRSTVAKDKNTLEAYRAQLSKKGGVTAQEAVQFLLAREQAKKNR